MVRAEVGRRGVAARRAIEHPAQPHTVHNATMHAEADNPTCPVVHHDEYPVRVEHGRFASKQIETPQTVLRVTQNVSQPPRTRTAGDISAWSARDEDSKSVDGFRTIAERYHSARSHHERAQAGDHAIREAQSWVTVSEND